MARTNTYAHFCPAARTLEVIGEKWSLLVVRDLLRGPQRFSDLLRFVGGITPKWLTARLRDLESEGIIERDSKPGRREVWYRLTPKGRDLGPVFESLLVWGVDHAIRPPLPGETVNPEIVLQGTAAYLNHRGLRLPGPARWEFRTGDHPPRQLRFDGERWSSAGAEAEADIVVTTTTLDLVTFLNTRRRERSPLLPTLRIEGDPPATDVFLGTMMGRFATAR